MSCVGTLKESRSEVSERAQTENTHACPYPLSTQEPDQCQLKTSGSSHLDGTCGSFPSSDLEELLSVWRVWRKVVCNVSHSKAADKRVEEGAKIVCKGLLCQPTASQVWCRRATEVTVFLRERISSPPQSSWGSLSEGSTSCQPVQTWSKHQIFLMSLSSYAVMQATGHSEH